MKSRIERTWSSLRCSDFFLVLMVTGLAYSLYWLTVAPTVLWGDDGHLQLNAVQRLLQGSAGSHPMWVWIAHQFTRFLGGDVARRVNLVSSVFGALTVGLLFVLLRELGLKRAASFLTVLAFMVSHTFWQHAVRAEVYTLTMTVLLLFAWLGLRWFHTGNPWILIAAALVFGLGLGVHLLMGLYAPACLWLLWRRRPHWRTMLGAGLALVLGLLPLMLLLVRDTVTLHLQGMEILRWALFSFENYDFSGAMFDFSLQWLADDAFQWTFFLVFQFVGLAVLCGFWGMWRVWKRLPVSDAIYVVLIYGMAFVFAFAYRVGDRYVFYLPSYVAFAVWMAVGFEELLQYLQHKFSKPARLRVAYGIIVLAVLLVPVGSYRLAPELVERGLSFRDGGHVPGPAGKTFFLWPAKNGYTDPREYAESALQSAPPGALLLAEPILASPLRFLQIVEGVRQDVEVGYCCWDIEQVLPAFRERAVAIAVVDLDVYTSSWLQNHEVEPLGSLWALSEGN
ncbi:MAG: DUF2723 domain-containing protein [Anaerolineae bacterium]|nr:DUF2723 domain-containing protein [Anaerolineae bacterium]